MNIFANIMYYGSIATIIFGLICCSIGLWLLLSKRGKQRITNLKQKLKEYDSNNNDKNIGAKGG